MYRASGQVDEQKKVHLEKVAKGYLIRYFDLIAFSSYLHSKRKELKRGKEGGTFEEWVKEKKEVNNLLLNVALK